MFFDDHKKAITTMMAKRKPGGGERTTAPMSMKPEHSMSSDNEPDGRHAASEDMIAAMHERSPQKMTAALAHFMDMHNAMDNKPEPDSDLY